MKRTAVVTMRCAAVAADTDTTMEVGENFRSIPVASSKERRPRSP